MSDLLSRLNDEQRAACSHGDGPLLIFAGAGSGKTRVLTHRVAHLIACEKARPSEILAVTFTNKAAAELKHRLAQLLSPEAAKYVWAGTFHATCARLLRMEGEAIGIPPEFVIYDESEKLSAIKRALQELNLDAKRFEPRAVSYRISDAKNELMGPVEFAEYASEYMDVMVARVYRKYDELLSRGGALDFDDLIRKAVELLRRSKEVREKYSTKFRYVLVDEFQDINQAQYELVKALASHWRNLAVVGDDDQSIYRWRGADVRLMLEFEKDFPEARTIKLERNYRSTKPILEAAWHVIRKNRNRADKKLWTDRQSDEAVTVYDAVDGMDEARYVLSTIQTAVRTGEAKYADFAILFRTNAQSREFEEQLLRLQIPYRLVGGFRFYDRKEVKDAVAYLRLAHNERDDVSLQRIINEPPRGIGKTTLDLIEAKATELGVSMLAALQVLLESGELAARQQKALAEFVKLIGGLKAHIAEEKSLPKLLRQSLQLSGYLAWLREQHSSDAEERIENLQELENVATQFEEGNPEGGLSGFLEHLALMTDLDQADTGSDRLWLMTLHSAKGLEFPTVFLVGMEEGLCPHLRSLDDPQSLEEERRLCYVGMTRAMDKLYISSAARRMIYGRSQPSVPSRFLAEVPEELLDRASPAFSGGRSSSGRPASLFGTQEAPISGRKLDLNSVLSSRKQGAEQTSRPSKPPSPEAAGFKPGSLVVHSTFGQGTVVSVSGSIVTVAFPDKGVKKLDASVAPLSPA